MKTVKILFTISFIFVAVLSCKKKDIQPIDTTSSSIIEIKQYQFQFMFNGGHNTQLDTLIIKYNGVLKTTNKTFFRVQTGDKISIYYNPGYYFAAIDSNKVKLNIDGITFKTYNCTCITNETIIIP